MCKMFDCVGQVGCCSRVRTASLQVIVRHLGSTTAELTHAAVGRRRSLRRERPRIGLMTLLGLILATAAVKVATVCTAGKTSVHQAHYAQSLSPPGLQVPAVPCQRADTPTVRSTAQIAVCTA